ncbi:MAG TPA: TetR/AcrR family transcriptional regulator [Casimicrobiaceae bacterium]
MPRKPPRRTRERILATALALFNRSGEPNVTTADIADEMNISPGNLYYHFRNKDEIIGELYAALDAAVAPLLAGPSARAANVEDLWLFLHLMFERMWQYRFFYRDLDEITSRNARLAARFADLTRRSRAAVIELCRGLRAAGAMDASDHEIGALSTSVVMITTYWMSFQRLSRAVASSPEDPAEMRFEHAAAQVLALLAPYLHGPDRALVERLGADYRDGASAADDRSAITRRE